MAVVVTAGLLYMMQALIQMDEMELDETPRGATLVFLPTMDDVPLEVPPKNPEPPEPPELPPETPHVITTIEGPTVEYGVYTGPTTDEFAVPTPHSSLPDGGPMAIVKVTPQYPHRASEKGIEGYVVVQFTISKAGEVLNPTVLEAEPSNIFNRSALRAVTKFKYKPKIVNGESVAVPNVLHRIVYQLDKV
jgi:protein TonB